MTIWYDMIHYIYMHQKADSQLILPHGSKQKKSNEKTKNKNRDAQKKWSSAIKSMESDLRQGREFMVGKICERGMHWAGSEREREFWKVTVVSWQAIEHEQGSQRRGLEWGWQKELRVDSKDKLRHTERNDQLCITRMMFVVERG